MRPPASEAGNSFISIIRPLGFVAVNPALYAEAGSRAAIQKGRHSLLSANARPFRLEKCQGRPGPLKTSRHLAAVTAGELAGLAG
jgi:hypothetical protein